MRDREVAGRAEAVRARGYRNFFRRHPRREDVHRIPYDDEGHYLTLERCNDGDTDVWYLSRTPQYSHVVNHRTLSPYVWKDTDGNLYVHDCNVWRIGGVTITCDILIDILGIMYPERAYLIAGDAERHAVTIESVLGMHSRLMRTAEPEADLEKRGLSTGSRTLEYIRDNTLRHFKELGMGETEMRLALSLWQDGIRNGRELLATIAAVTADTQRRDLRESAGAEIGVCR